AALAVALAHDSHVADVNTATSHGRSPPSKSSRSSCTGTAHVAWVGASGRRRSSTKATATATTTSTAAMANLSTLSPSRSGDGDGGGDAGAADAVDVPLHEYRPGRHNRRREVVALKVIAQPERHPPPWRHGDVLEPLDGQRLTGSQG